MIYWILWLAVDSEFNRDYPYHFSMRNTCESLGKTMVNSYKFKEYKCIKEIRE